MGPAVSWGVWLAKVRMLFARRPWTYWTIAGACAATAALQVHGAVSSADAAKAAWGTTRAVWVVTAPAAPGDVVRGAQRTLPVAVVPQGAVDTMPDGATAAHRLAVGSVVTDLDVRDPRDVPDGWLVVTAPADRAPAVAAGDEVTLIGASGARCDGRGVREDDTRVDVAVPAECATTLTADLLADDVVVARRVGG